MDLTAGTGDGPVAAPGSAQALIAAHMQDPGSQWSVGTFVAIAEFMRDGDEPAVCNVGAVAATIVTGRGAIRLAAPPRVRPVATESANTQGWNHRVALCLPVDVCAMHRRTALTEIGPDAGSVRDEDRGAILFDLGLGALQADICVRTRDPALIARLRLGVGRPVFDPENPAMGAILAASPHRVFVCGFGRIEVYQPIPAAHGKSPEGPHTHVLPNLLRSGLTHAATEAIPAGLVPCAHIYPAHPAKDALGRITPFDAARHRAFQSTLRLYGDPELVAVKDRVLAALEARLGPDEITVPNTRYARAAVRVALRQAEMAGLTSSVLPQWVARHDRTREPDEIENDPARAH